MEAKQYATKQPMALKKSKRKSKNTWRQMKMKKTTARYHLNEEYVVTIYTMEYYSGIKKMKFCHLQQ